MNQPGIKAGPALVPDGVTFPVQELYRSLFLSPQLLPWQLDMERQRLLLALMQEEQYRQAVFLDQRLNKDGKIQAFWTPLEKLFADCRITGSFAKPACFLFHIGHCGSTLVSRLLAHEPSIMPIREPLAWRSLASAHRDLGRPQSFVSESRWNEIFTLLLGLLTRSYSPAQKALVKSSSNCNPLLPLVLEADPGHRAILLYTDLETYLASLLRPQSRDALYAFSQERIIDLQRVAGADTPALHQLPPASLGAMNWCASMLQFPGILENSNLRDRVRLVNFEDFLARPPEALAGLFEFCGVDRPAEAARAALGGTDYLRTYAKDASFDYSPELRTEDLRVSKQAHMAEIAAARRWLEGLISKVPALAGLVPLLGSQARVG